MLSEVSQRKERYCEAPLICRMEKETIQRELINKTGTQSQIREGNFGCQRRSMGGRESQGVWDGHGHTALFIMENQQGPAGQHRGLCSLLCNNLMVPRGEDGGRDGQGVWDGHGHTAVPGASVRNSTRDKAMWKSSDGKANQTSGFPPGIS